MQSFVFFLEAKHPQIYEGKSIFNKKKFIILVWSICVITWCGVYSSLC